MECDERDRLTRACTAFLSDYRRSLQVLEGMTGVMARDIYRRVKEGAEQAKQQSERAKADLDLHVASHGCCAEPLQCGAAGDS